VRFRGIRVRMRRTLWGMFLLCSKPVLNKCINSSYMLHSRCRNYVSMSTSMCSPTDESCSSVSKILEWLRRPTNLLYNDCWEDYFTGGVKPLRREADHSVHRVTRLICLHGTYRDVFTFNFTFFFTFNFILIQIFISSRSCCDSWVFTAINPGRKYYCI